jgi:hypothetical protein
MWIYKNEIINNISNFPENSFGFIYMITHIPSGKKYIGKKVLFNNKKTKIGKKEKQLIVGKGRKPEHKITTIESNWKTYNGSNKLLLDLFNKEPQDNFLKTIIDIGYNKKHLTYLETKYQFINNVLEHPDKWFNDNIQGRFYGKDFK